MSISPLAGKPAPPEILIDVDKLEKDYFENKPDTADPDQLVSFGTSGHRGTSLNGTFTEAHILAITQAICEFRVTKKITGPLFMGKDTHALSDSRRRPRLKCWRRTAWKRSSSRAMESRRPPSSRTPF